jgi:hypothetical protein
LLARWSILEETKGANMNTFALMLEGLGFTDLEVQTILATRKIAGRLSAYELAEDLYRKRS